MEKTAKVMDVVAFNNEKGKMTKLEKFELLQSLIATDRISKIGKTQLKEVNSFLQNEVELLSKKSDKRKTDKKPTKLQLENLKVADLIAETLVKLKDDKNADYFYSGAEIGNLLEEDFTPQKVTSLMKILVDKEVVNKGVSNEDKKRVGYKLA